MSKILKCTWNPYFVLTSYGLNADILYINKRHTLQYDINDITYCKTCIKEEKYET